MGTATATISQSEQTGQTESAGQVEQKSQGEQSGFMRRAAWLTGANVVSFALSFAAPLLIVRLLSQSEFGVYKQSFQILSTALAVLNFQVASSTYYFMPRMPDKKLQVAMNVILFYAVAGLLLALAFVIYPQWATAIFHSADVAEHVPLLGVAILFWLVSANLEVMPLAMGDVRTASVFIVAAQLSKSALIIGAALIFRTVHAVMWAAVLQGVFQAALTLGYIRRRCGSFRKPLDWPLFKAQIGNAIPYGVGSIAQNLQNDLHNYFVSFFFPPALFAVYAVGCFQLPLLGLLQGSFNSVLIPEVAQLEAAGDRQGIVNVWFNAMRKLALAFLPAFALMFVVRRELITLLFTQKYADSVAIFGIFLFGLIPSMILTGPILRAFAEFRFFRLKLYLALLPITCLGLYVGIKSGGLIGAITAVVALQMLEAALTLVAIGRKLGVTAKDFKQLAPMIPTALAALAAALVVLMAKTALAQHVPVIILLAVCGLVFSAVYVVVGLAVGAITTSEKIELYGAVQRGYRIGAARMGLSSTTQA